MQVKRSLSLSVASHIVDAALARAAVLELAPIAVAVLDSGGHLVAFKSEDGCGVMRFGVAMGKAYGALGMGTSGRDLEQRLAERPNFASALAAVSGGQFVANPGGVLILDRDGLAIGAVGISGDTSAKDDACAIDAIHATDHASLP